MIGNQDDIFIWTCNLVPTVTFLFSYILPVDSWWSIPLLDMESRPEYCNETHGDVHNIYRDMITWITYSISREVLTFKYQSRSYQGFGLLDIIWFIFFCYSISVFAKIHVKSFGLYSYLTGVTQLLSIQLASGTGPGIFRANYVNIMSGEALAPCVAMSAAAMILIVCNVDMPVFVMASSSGNIFRVTGPLWGESTGDLWIPPTKDSDTELWCSLMGVWTNG